MLTNYDWISNKFACLNNQLLRAYKTLYAPSQLTSQHAD